MIKKLRLTEKSNLDNITKAADYYYPRWESEVMDTSQIRDELTRLGHSEDFIDATIELIFDKYDDNQRYWDEYDESLKLKESGMYDYYDTPDNDYSTFMGDTIPNGKPDKIYKHKLTVPESIIEEFAEFVADYFNEDFNDIVNNESNNVWMDDFDSENKYIIIMCSDDEFDDIENWVNKKSLRTKSVKERLVPINEESEWDDDWQASIPEALWDVVHEMEKLGWEAVGYFGMGVDYCIGLQSPTRPEISYEKCVHITSPEFSADETSISVGKWIDVYNYEIEKELPSIPNNSGVLEFRTKQDVRKFTDWFKKLGTSYTVK